MKKRMQTDFEEIKETDTQLPSSRREIEEDMLEQICLIANAGAEITVEELGGRTNMSRREVNFYLKTIKKLMDMLSGRKIRIQDYRGEELNQGFFSRSLGRLQVRNFNIVMKF